MGMVNRALGLVLGNGNIIAQTAEVFRENAEGAAARQADMSAAALAQFAAEFARPPAGRFDRVMDGLNRVPRPALALGTMGLFVSAMVDPVWFASRMTGLALIPEPLWWLLGAIVSFYFGARHQVKGQEFQRSIAAALARTPEVAAGLRSLSALAPPVLTEPNVDEPAHTAPPPTQPLGQPAAPRAAAPGPSDNPALDDWRAQHG